MRLSYSCPAMSSTNMLGLFLSSLCFVIATVSGGKNWAVILSTSRYWFNYRHTSNAFTVYHIMKEFGYPDSQIITMTAMDAASDPRNPLPGSLYNSRSVTNGQDLMNSATADYVGDEVNAQNFLDILTGRNSISIHKKLESDEDSNIFIFMTGHGGDEFFKFHDSEELSAHTFGLAFDEMWIKKRYSRIFLVVETCKAATMANYITAKNVISFASSLKGENSYGYYVNEDLGVSVVDRFTYIFREVMSDLRRAQKRGSFEFNFKELAAKFDPRFLSSHTQLILPAGTKSEELNVIDFFRANNATENHLLEKNVGSVSEVIEYFSSPELSTGTKTAEYTSKKCYSRSRNEESIMKRHSKLVLALLNILFVYILLYVLKMFLFG